MSVGLSRTASMTNATRARIKAKKPEVRFFSSNIKLWWFRLFIIFYYLLFTLKESLSFEETEFEAFIQNCPYPMILYDNSYIRSQSLIENPRVENLERKDSQDTLTTIDEMKDEQYFSNEEYFAKAPETVPQTDYDLFVEWMKTRKIEETQPTKSSDEKIVDTISVSSDEEFLESQDIIDEIPVIEVQETKISTNPFEDEEDVLPTTLLSVATSSLTASQSSLTPSQNSDVEGENSSSGKRPVTHTKGRAPEPPKISEEKKKKSLLGYIPNIFRSETSPANKFESDSMKETAI